MSAAIEKQVGDWYPLLKPLFTSDIFKEIGKEIKLSKAKMRKILPETTKTFRAFKLCQLKDVKVIILGEEPYSEGQATGLAFAVGPETPRIPLQLTNIVTALEQEGDTLILNFDYTLEHWAKQGVLLLNSALTVERGYPGVHIDVWKPFTQKFIELLSSNRDDLVFVLWGDNLQEYDKHIKGNNKIHRGGAIDIPPNINNESAFCNSEHFRNINNLCSSGISWRPNLPLEFPKRTSTTPF